MYTSWTLHNENLDDFYRSHTSKLCTTVDLVRACAIVAGNEAIYGRMTTWPAKGQNVLSRLQRYDNLAPSKLTVT